MSLLNTPQLVLRDRGRWWQLSISTGKQTETKVFFRHFRAFSTLTWDGAVMTLENFDWKTKQNRGVFWTFSFSSIQRPQARGGNDIWNFLLENKAKTSVFFRHFSSIQRPYMRRKFWLENKSKPKDIFEHSTPIDDGKTKQTRCFFSRHFRAFSVHRWGGGR